MVRLLEARRSRRKRKVKLRKLNFEKLKRPDRELDPAGAYRLGSTYAFVVIILLDR